VRRSQTYPPLYSAGTVHGEPLQGPEAGHRPSLRVELGLDCQVEKLIVSSVEELGGHGECRRCIICTRTSWGKTATFVGLLVHPWSAVSSYRYSFATLAIIISPIFKA
jgi:hypothetical protein